MNRSHESGNYVLDFQSTNYERDAEITYNLLLTYASKTDLHPDDMLFSLTEPMTVAGRSFSKLILKAEFVARIISLHSHAIEMENPLLDVNGKYHAGLPLLTQFAFWLSKKLQDAGAGVNVKIGEDMADMSYGEGSWVGFSWSLC